MSKPWSMETFPIDRPVYIRQKGNPAGASLVVSIAPAGVNLCLSPKGDGKAIMQGISWFGLHNECEHVLPRGKVGPCGTRV